MSEAPGRIGLVQNGLGEFALWNREDNKFDPAIEYVRADIACAELEAAGRAERDTLDQLFDEAAEIRRTFCLATPGTDAEFKAWIHGFDTAVAHFAAAIRNQGEKK